MPEPSIQGSIATRHDTGEIGGRGEAAHLGWVDAMRAVACLCVVAYHAIGNDPAHGLRLAEGSFGWMVARLLDLFQMPLFAFVSGRVFAVPTDDPARFRAALGRKTVRIAVPLAVATAIYLVLSRFSGGEVARPIEAFLLPYQHLWYLQATLWLVPAAAIGSLAFRTRPLAFAIGALFVATLAFLIAPDPSFNLLSLAQAVYLAPYFFLGLLLGRLREAGATRLEGSRDRVAIAGLLVLLVIATVLVRFGFEATGGRSMPIQTVAGLSFAVALALLAAVVAPRLPALAPIARASYTIYLFHVATMAPMRMIALKLWPEVPLVPLFFVLVAGGVGVPMVLHAIVMRSRLLAFLIEGVLPRTRGGPAR